MYYYTVLQHCTNVLQHSICTKTLYKYKRIFLLFALVFKNRFFLNFNYSITKLYLLMNCHTIHKNHKCCPSHSKKDILSGKIQPGSVPQNTSAISVVVEDT
ncbi:hypothetical protein OTU49_014142 [Cherax quadricarinatus]|uniref:Uncharacterized protein n=1 Tax=Cherax quadricarinatus TaxID=27406 RepID=A0AAW0VR07_CHEQU